MGPPATSKKVHKKKPDLDPYETPQSNRMFPDPPGTWRKRFLSYVVHFATYGHFPTQKVDFDHEGVEL